MPRRKYEAPIRDIYLAGELAGLASKLDVNALEEYLNSVHSENFSHHESCRKVIAFVRSLNPPLTISPPKKEGEE